jgi:hypothetical protein
VHRATEASVTKIRVPAMPASNDAERLLGVYLRDHDGASAGGVRLVHRSRRSNRGTPFEPGLAELEMAIIQDQAEFRQILSDLGIRPSRVKQTVAWLGATAGVVKLNRRLVTYSPLSRLEEIEALSAAVMAKFRLWSALADVAVADDRLDEQTIGDLRQRAGSQLDSLADMHREATAVAFDTRSARQDR